MNIEKQLISTLANYPDLVNKMTVTQSDFGGPRTSQIFQTVVNLIRDDRSPDIILLAETMNFGSDEDWFPEIAKCYEELGAPENFEAYERIVIDNKRQRDLRRISGEFSRDLDGHRAVDAIRSLDTVGGTGIEHMSNVAPSVVQYVEDVGNGLITPGLTTGIADLDNIMGGLNGGDQVIVAARTSVGKTAFMCNLAANVNQECLIMSGEQGKDQIAQRIMAKMGNISAHRLRMGRLNSDEQGRLVDAATKLAQSKIYIVDKPRMTIEDIERTTRAAHWQYGIKAVFIDYLQLIKNSAYQEKRLQISDISARGKALAKELNIPVIMLAQLNRNADGKTPRLADLKESGSIEEDADVVILLYKDEEKEGELIIDVQKNRNGPTSKFEVMWEPEFMRVRSMERRW